MNPFAIFFLLLLVLPPRVQGQAKVLTFLPAFHEQPLTLGQSYYCPALGDSLRIDVFRMYLSDITLFRKGEKVGTATERYVLLDVENPASLRIRTSAQGEVDSVSFLIGIDSVTSLAGAMGGDLDPTNGMYWTWQSGYINLKLEGVSPACPGRNHRFQFHIGGYQAPYSTVQQVSLLPGLEKDLVIQVAVDRFLSQVNLRETYLVMSPGARAAALASLLPSLLSNAPSP